MKNRTSLTLLELLLMIMVLALAAALCIRAFAYSGRLSKEDRIKAEAMAKAQNAAELIKHYKGDVEKAFSKLGWVYIEGFGAELDEDWKDCGHDRGRAKYHVLTAPYYENEEPLLGNMLITVVEAESDSIICSINAAWQEDKQ